MIRHRWHRLCDEEFTCDRSLSLGFLSLLLCGVGWCVRLPGCWFVYGVLVSSRVERSMREFTLCFSSVDVSCDHSLFGGEAFEMTIRSVMVAIRERPVKVTLRGHSFVCWLALRVFGFPTPGLVA